MTSKVTNVFQKCKSEIYNTVIVGGGPAGIGPIVAASKAGKLQELLDRKICLIESGADIGGGDLCNYTINSDTPGGVLLECFGEHNEQLLGHVRSTPDAVTLANNDSNFVPLKLIGSFLNDIGACLKTQFDNHPTSRALTKSKVAKITSKVDGLYVVTVESRSDDGQTQLEEIVARKIILACGGSQSLSDDKQKRLFGTGACLNDFPNKLVIGSDAVLKADDSFNSFLEKLNLGEIKEVTVLGSSHSAFASALVLLKRVTGLKSSLKINIAFRTEPKIYYQSAADAIADGYSNFDDNDICVTTDRVYRFGGLRMESRELLRRVSGLDKLNKEVRVELVKFSTEAELNKLLSNSCAVISALGYTPDYPPIYDSKGQQTILGTSNGKFVDQYCRILKDNGTVAENLYGVGLASGFVPDNGGEPSFKGQTNSIWIYQNPAGNILLDHLLDDSAELTSEIA